MHGIDKIKRISAASLAILLLSGLTVQAFADEGQAIGNFVEGRSAASVEDKLDSVSSGNLIALSDGSAYDADTGYFIYGVEDSRFGISVPNGAIVTEAVAAVSPASLSCVLYKNGTEQKDAELSCIAAPGSYVLAVTANDASRTTRVSFTILSSPTGRVKEYKMPADFYVVSATLNGEATGYSQSCVSMSSDGDYVIDYRSPEADKDFRLCVTVDHTPPTAVLSGVVNGKSNEPVVVSEVEDGARVFLEKNRRTIDYTGTIEETGTYKLTIQDEAGNETVYDFSVVTFARDSVKLLIATAAVLLLALIGGLVYYRKYMRVS